MFDLQSENYSFSFLKFKKLFTVVVFSGTYVLARQVQKSTQPYFSRIAVSFIFSLILESLRYDAVS